MKTTAVAVTPLSPGFGALHSNIRGCESRKYSDRRGSCTNRLGGRRFKYSVCAASLAESRHRLGAGTGKPSGRWMISRCRRRLASMVSAVMHHNASLCAAGRTRRRVDHALDRRFGRNSCGVCSARRLRCSVRLVASSSRLARRRVVEIARLLLTARVQSGHGFPWLACPGVRRREWS